MTDDLEETPPAPPRVTIAAIRELGARERKDGKTYCAQAIRDWCAIHDIDYLELVREGISVERMRATDGMGQMAADLVDPPAPIEETPEEPPVEETPPEPPEEPGETNGQ